MNQCYFAIGTTQCECGHMASYSIVYRPPQESIIGLLQEQADDGFESCFWLKETVRTLFEVPLLSIKEQNAVYSIFVVEAKRPMTSEIIHCTVLAETEAQAQLLLANVELVYHRLDAQFPIQNWRYEVNENGETVKINKKYTCRVLETVNRQDGRVRVRSQYKEGKWKQDPLDYKLFVME